MAGILGDARGESVSLTASMVVAHPQVEPRPYRDLTCVRLFLPQARQVCPCFFGDTMSEDSLATPNATE